MLSLRRSKNNLSQEDLISSKVGSKRIGDLMTKAEIKCPFCGTYKLLTKINKKSEEEYYICDNCSSRFKVDLLKD